MRIDECIVECPRREVGQSGAVLIGIVETIVGRSIEAVVEESDVSHVDSTSVVPYVVGIYHLLPPEVIHHDAESTGEVCPFSFEHHIVDGFVAEDVLILDIAHVVHVAFFVDEVDIGVGIGDNDEVQCWVSANSGDADVGQAVDLVQNLQAVVFRVVSKKLILGCGIDLRTQLFNSDDILVRHVGTPIPDADTLLGQQAHSQRERQQQQKESQMLHRAMLF